jgi:hypothetical protein
LERGPVVGNKEIAPLQPESIIRYARRGVT